MNNFLILIMWIKCAICLTVYPHKFLGFKPVIIGFFMFIHKITAITTITTNKSIILL